MGDLSIAICLPRKTRKNVKHLIEHVVAMAGTSVKAKNSKNHCKGMFCWTCGLGYILEEVESLQHCGLTASCLCLHCRRQKQRLKPKRNGKMASAYCCFSKMKPVGGLGGLWK